MLRLIVLPVVLLLACLACGSDLRVTTIQLGRSLNADNTVAAQTTTFAPDETVHLSVRTAGRGSGTISVRWTYGDRVVGEPKKPVSYSGPAITPFHLQNAGGFPPGEYTAEVFLDGQSVGTKSFRVEKR